MASSSSSSIRSTSTDVNDDVFDLVIIGAGISGINCAYRLQTELPHLKFVILEGRDSIGGTWDLFRYPGVRSDSNMYTLGFTWHPWTFDRPIATGNEIMEYLTDAVARHRLDRLICFRHRVLSADWSSADKVWSLSVDGHYKRGIKATWVILSTGYYDYESPLRPDIPGLDSFQGKIVSPQFWPADLDYGNKKIAMIGSGATAVTLLPALAKRAAQVTLIQRSPSYIVPSRNAAKVYRFMPSLLANKWRWLSSCIVGYITVLLCQYYPDSIRAKLKKTTARLLPQKIDFDTHFKPRYNPWEQRICLDPDAKFYKALHQPNVEIVTGEIESVTSDGITMKRGTREGEDPITTAADIIITATGLRLKMGGEIVLRVDGEPISWQKRYIWNGAMLDAVPNLMFMIGYTNNAWTIGADNTAAMLMRLLKYTERRALRVVRPRTSAGTRRAGTTPFWQLSSTYVKVVEDELPVYGVVGNWRPRNRPPMDYLMARWGDYTSGLVFTD